MKLMPVSQARAIFPELMDSVCVAHEPIMIQGRRGCAVLLSSEDWQAIHETLHLLSVPGMRESIRRGLKTPLSRSQRIPGW